MALWLVGGSLLVLLRQSGVPAIDSLWAEDGHIFYSQSLRDGSEALGVPYSGYMHLLPRLVALLATVLPAGGAATVFAVASAAILALIALYVFVVGSTMLRTRVGAGVLAALVLLLPAAADESLNNAANLQWHLILPCFLALVHLGESRGSTAVGSVITFLSATSAPVTAIFTPLALWRIFKLRGGHAILPAAMFLLGLAIQAVVVVTSDFAPFTEGTNAALLPGLFGLRVAGSLLVGERLLRPVWAWFGWGFAFAALAAVAVLLVWGLLRHDVDRRLLAVAAVASVATFASTVAIRGTSLILPRGDDPGLAATRWTIGPILLLALALILVLEVRDPRVSSTVWRGTLVLLAALLGTAMVVGFRPQNLRSDGPRWSAEMRQAERYCRQSGIAGVLIPLSPPGWAVTVPCDRIV